MRRELIVLLLLGLTASLANAQEYRIFGTVKDTEENPIILANVLLLTLEGNTLKGTATNDNGTFEFLNVAQGTYQIEASYIENKITSPAFEVKADVEVAPLVLSGAQELEEVTVERQKPRLQQLADRLVFTIENTALSDNDIWNVLKRTPGIIVMNNTLSINGSSNIGVLINGKRVNLPQEDIMNLLSGNSASNVESIEVITNPPAKYSAEGGLLIDIKMKKNLVAGYNGSIFNRYTQGVLPKHTVGTDHFFKGKKVDFSTNYSFRSDRSLTKHTDITNFFQEGAINETWSAEQESVDRRKSHYLNLFLDYQVDEKNTLSISSINSLTPNLKRNFDSETSIRDTGGRQTASFLTTNATDYDVFNTSVYLDWLHKLNDNGAELATNATYTYYDYQRNQQLENRFTEGEDEFLANTSFSTSANQLVNLFSLQTDLTLPLDKNAKMEIGLRYAGINSEANIVQTGLDQIRPGTDPTLNGIFNYDEDIYAAYVSMNTHWEHWKLNLGLRTEYTETLGVLNATNSQNTNSYLEWFPSLSLSHTLNPKNSVFFKYYRRITRPRYNAINPFQYFQTANSIVEGNPNLRPALRNYASFEYSFDRSLRIVLFGSQQRSEQSQQVFQDNTTNLLRFQYINLNTNYNAGADVSISKDLTEYWNTFFLLSYFYDENRFTDFESNLEQSNSIWTSHIRATNSFKFLSDKSLFAEATYTYFSPLIDGNARQEAFSEVGISLRKTLWNRKASISLAVEDMFRNGNRRATREYLQQNNSTYTRRETRLFVLGFRYKFGNTKIRDNYKNKDTEENRRI